MGHWMGSGLALGEEDWGELQGENFEVENSKNLRVLLSMNFFFSIRGMMHLSESFCNGQDTGREGNLSSFFVSILRVGSGSSSFRP